jgi:hypothetical protein
MGPLVRAKKKEARKKRRKKRAVKVSPTIEFDEEMDTMGLAVTSRSRLEARVDPRRRDVGSQEYTDDPHMKEA